MAVSLKQFYEELYLEHLEEGAFLYENLQPWREDPEGSWSDCKELEDRLEAHLDALVIGENTAKQILLDAAEEGGPGELYVITSVLCRLNELAEVNKIWEILIGTPEELKQASEDDETDDDEPDPDNIAKVHAVAYAMRLEYPDPSRSKLPKLLESPHGELLPIIAPTVDELQSVNLNSARNLLEKCPSWYLPEAVRIVGNALEKNYIPFLTPLLTHKNQAVKREAAIALLKSGHFDIVAMLLEDPETFAIPLAFCGDTQAVKKLFEVAKGESVSADILYALGFTGQLAAIKPLVIAMSDESLAVAAANAAQLILATDLYEEKFVEETFEKEDLFDHEIEAFEKGEMPKHPGGDAYGENIQQISTDPERWRDWLRNNKQNFDTQQCYRLGEPFSAKSVCRSLYRPIIPFAIRQHVHDELVIRFKLNLPCSVTDPVDLQIGQIQAIANWVQQD